MCSFFVLCAYSIRQIHKSNKFLKKKKAEAKKEKEENKVAEVSDDDEGSNNEGDSEDSTDIPDSENKEYEQVVKRRTKRLIRINILFFGIFFTFFCLFIAWYIIDIIRAATGILFIHLKGLYGQIQVVFQFKINLFINSTYKIIVNKELIFNFII
jgi:hypothetical protein